MVGWKISEAQRRSLLLAFPPRYKRVLAEGIGLPRRQQVVPLPVATRALVVGELDDGRALQALMIRVQSYIDSPGGGLFHMLWSADTEQPLDPAIVDQAISTVGWRQTPLLPIQLTPG
jgi:hypothetical protein